MYRFSLRPGVGYCRPLPPSHTLFHRLPPAGSSTVELIRSYNRLSPIAFLVSILVALPIRRLCLPRAHHAPRPPRFLAMNFHRSFALHLMPSDNRCVHSCHTCRRSSFAAMRLLPSPPFGARHLPPPGCKLLSPYAHCLFNSSSFVRHPTDHHTALCSTPSACRPSARHHLFIVRPRSCALIPRSAIPAHAAVHSVHTIGQPIPVSGVNACNIHLHNVAGSVFVAS